MNKQGKIALIAILGIALIFAATAVLAKPGGKGGGAAKECRDGIDNDGDGNTDWPADAGCSNKNDKDESNCGDNVCEGSETISSCPSDCQICGNNAIEGAEVCDGSDLAGESCQTQGFDNGALSCTLSCDSYDTSGCSSVVCGDNVVEGAEVCDGSNLAGESCQTQGFDNGALSCTSSCDSYDTSGCSSAICGNNAVEGNETCDGSDLSGQSCQSLGYTGGLLSCSPTCQGYDTSGCSSAICGNNVVEGNETCDGSDLSGETCTSQGFDGGSLGCLSSCNGLDTSSCWTNTCSDTDAGYDIYVAGTIFGENTGSPYNGSDTCNGVMLTEWYCDGTTPRSATTSCGMNETGSCSAGACA